MGFIMWFFWSFATLLSYTVINYACLHSTQPLLKKISTYLRIIDQQLIKTHLLKEISIKKLIKIFTWYIIFNIFIVIYINIFCMFFIYYLVCVSYLKRWEKLSPLLISNTYEHRLLSCLLVLPNAFAYYILNLLIDLFSKQELLNFAQLFRALILRILLGFSPLFIHTLELVLVLNLKQERDRKVFFDKLLSFYTNILHHYFYRKIVKLKHNYISVELF